ncbi:MAG: hypothetical protein CME62_06415 [Halobacteriovoraceae bacterium]|nr:hypothetical protein [Halobacteriovoraceae bacterium]|tara:strand:+ start:2597 stop:3253 length:657 start_codon:yes stop_codon:yes gene_type:complete
MIRIWILCLSLFSSVYAAKVEYPHLYFAVGIPYIEIQGNHPARARDFTALNIGSTLQYNISEEGSIGLVIDASYTPDRKDMKIKENYETVEGDTSLLTSFYSLVYMQRFAHFENHRLWFTLGPTLGLYTLDFRTLHQNEADISTVNRVRVRNHGYRVSFKLMNKDRKTFYELAFYSVEEEKFTIIDDSSNDAEELYEVQSQQRRTNQAIILNYGFRLF